MRTWSRRSPTCRPRPPVAAFLSSGRHPGGGTTTYPAPDGERLVGYASLADFGWGVIVERPTAVALAGVRSVARAGLRRPAGLHRGGRAGRGVFDSLAQSSAGGAGGCRAPTRRGRLRGAAADESADRDCPARVGVSADARGRRQPYRGARPGQSRAARERSSPATAHGRRTGRHLRHGRQGKPYYANAAAEQLLRPRADVEAPICSELASVYQVYVADTDRLYPADELPIVRALAGESVTVDDLEIRRPTARRILLDVRATPDLRRHRRGRVRHGDVLRYFGTQAIRDRSCGWRATRRSTPRGPRAPFWPR